jgi:hypothetical protein
MRHMRKLDDTREVPLMRPRLLPLVTSGIFIACGAHGAETYKPKHVNAPAQICVERFEENGILNIRPVDITITAAPRITLRGGQAACVYVPAGAQSISLDFLYPYGGPQERRSWTTPARTFTAAEGQIVSFELCAADMDASDPRWERGGWHDMWLMRRTDENSQRGCAVDERPAGTR